MHRFIDPAVCPINCDNPDVVPKIIRPHNLLPFLLSDLLGEAFDPFAIGFPRDAPCSFGLKLSWIDFEVMQSHEKQLRLCLGSLDLGTGHSGGLQIVPKHGTDEGRAAILRDEPV
jgi:hypothetical protein